MFALSITYPSHRNLTASPTYAPKTYEAGDTPEEAAQHFKREAAEDPRDLNALVDVLADGRELVYRDKATGRTVTCKHLEGVLV